MAVVPQGGNTGLVGRRGAAARRGGAQPGPAGPARAGGRRRRAGHRRCWGEPPAGRRRRRPGTGPRRADRQPGQCHGGRRGRHQRGRAAGAALRLDAGAGARRSRRCWPTAPCVSHLSGLVKDNTGYDYPAPAGRFGRHAGGDHRGPAATGAPAAGSGDGDRGGGRPGAGARARAARGADGGQPRLGGVLHPGRAWTCWPSHAGLAPPLRPPGPAYLLLEAAGPGAADDLAALAADRPAAVGTSGGGAGPAVGLPGAPSRKRPGFLGVPLKLDVSVPAAQWVRLASEVGRGGRGGRPGRPGDHLRARRGREPARERGASGPGGRAARGRGVRRSWPRSAGRSRRSMASAPSRPAGCRWSGPRRSGPCSRGSAARSTRPAYSTRTSCPADPRPAGWASRSGRASPRPGRLQLTVQPGSEQPEVRWPTSRTWG